jgi:hypothetical protein
MERILINLSQIVDFFGENIKFLFGYTQQYKSTGKPSVNCVCDFFP